MTFASGRQAATRAIHTSKRVLPSAATTTDQPSGSVAAGAAAGGVIHRRTDDRTDDSYFILENDSLHLTRNRVPRRSKKIPTNFFTITDLNYFFGRH